MQKQIYPNQALKGEVRLPASKSLCNRALVMTALASGTEGTALVGNLSDCDDTQVMLHALAAGREAVDIGAAGTAMRFLTALYAATPGRHVLTGTPRMRQRPIGLLVDALRALGAHIDYAGEEGFPPLAIEGRQLDGGTVSLPANVSSQYVSALLMTGPVMRRGLRLELTGDIASRPYIDMTLGLMRHFGARAAWTSPRDITVQPVPYAAGRALTVENDWSAASYWYEMVALAPDPEARLVLPGLKADSLQGDACVSHLFEPLGVATRFTPAGAVLTKADPVPADAAAGPALALDLTPCPDLAQTLVVTCALLGRPFAFTGLHSLRIKETDRLAALRCEMARLGYPLREANGSELHWHGDRIAADPRPVIRTYEDHRMAMAFAPAAYRFPGLLIDDPGVVSKSYPAFWNALARVGTRLTDLP